jgi:hypothetical protein
LRRRVARVVKWIALAGGFGISYAAAAAGYPGVTLMMSVGIVCGFIVVAAGEEP